MSALPQALRGVFGQRTRATLVNLTVILRFAASSLPLPLWGLG
jgi:hypothetical protein